MFFLSIHIHMKFQIIFTEMAKLAQIFSAATVWARAIYVIPWRER
jgi:hypothetical protein